MERRNFLVNFLLWILAFIFGYTVKTDSGAKVLQQIDFYSEKGKNKKELVHRGIISDVYQMRKTDFKKGDYVKTLGYYTEGDGGHAEYVVKTSRVKDNGGSVISLNNGLQAHLIYNGLINVKWFGARGDWDITQKRGSDDTNAIQNTLDFAKLQKVNAYFPAGKYGVKSLKYDDSSAGIIGEGKASTFIVAIKPCDTLVSVRNSVYIPIRDICFEGNNFAKTCLDTSFTYKDGPSVQNDYQEVRIRSYAEIGWKADSNNDCQFNHIMIEPVKNAIGLHIPANGGMIIFNNAMFLSPIKMSCQNAVFNGCMIYGILIEGKDNNHIQMNGSYWYADPKTKSNLHLLEDAVAYSPALNGARMENGYDKGAFIGGTGRLCNGGTFISPHLFTTHGAKNQRLVSDTVRSLGPKGHIRIINGIILGDVNVNSTKNITIMKETTQVNGKYDIKSEYQMMKTSDGISYSFMSGSEFGHHNSYGSVSKYIGGTTPTISKNKVAVINKAPESGIIIIRGTVKKAPIAVFIYSKLQDDEGLVTKLHEQKGAGGSHIDLKISSNSPIELQVSHTSPRKDALHYTVIGS
ncbi:MULTISPECIES: glycosyl hydrolase family 28-related protein [unclassified Priestia]|uniref:glycosyl hydrolase family 28-related protein n=1 Tax=unclassified Priestia TaxID=2800374 RepID=UPI003673568F